VNWIEHCTRRLKTASHLDSHTVPSHTLALFTGASNTAIVAALQQLVLDPK
jgi:hypothetical protein